MIGYVKGKLLSHTPYMVLLENNGIGYEITCSASAYKELVNNGGGFVYTYMQVREDGMFLYGFVSLQEKQMFLKLITVGGIGPKTGVAILSEMNIESLALAIASSDVKTLSKIKGIGKKTAERVILELREKVSSLDLQDASETIGQSLPNPTIDEDAVIALMTLGLSRGESVAAVKVATMGGAQTLEEKITAALKNI